ncbi:hypothetical protein [Cellulosimicrobium funkei]|uniref:hypothetical protein n=1 Tax=Cellulosimicrobium funkei TaxID=264251 RepID=UPI00341A12CC
MNAHDASALLTIAAAFDNRTVTEAAARAWAEAIHPAVTLDDGRAAIVEHYARSRDWIMPADINRGSRAARAARVAATPMPEIPDAIDPANVRQELAWTRSWTRAIADGATPHEAEIAAARAARIPAPPALARRDQTRQIGDHQ